MGYHQQNIQQQNINREVTMSLSHRKQSIDLKSKYIDWFLYGKDIGR